MSQSERALFIQGVETIHERHQFNGFDRCTCGELVGDERSQGGHVAFLTIDMLDQLAPDWHRFDDPPRYVNTSSWSTACERFEHEGCNGVSDRSGSSCGCPCHGSGAVRLR